MTFTAKNRISPSAGKAGPSHRQALSRRQVLAGGAALGASLAMPRIVRAADQEIVFATWGGSWEAAMRKAWFDPFQEKTGIAVKTISGNTYGKIEAMVKAGRTEWDVVETLPDFQWIGAEKGLLAPIDFKVVDKSAIMPGQDMVTDYSVPQVLFAEVLTYNTKLNPAPQGWVDLYDVSKFPGMRAFDGADVQAIMESALLADGVPPDTLYPLDIDRALKKLSTIRDQLQFFQTNAQGEQYLSDGQCIMGMLPDGRAINIRDNGAAVAIQYNATIMTWSTMVIPKGAPHLEAAQKFLAYALTPEAQAAIAMAYTYGPVVPKALELIPASRANILSGGPEMKGKAVLRGEKWWSENLATTNEKFNTWKLG
ncbi:MAG: ABC transporter substrate-binding protein [Rhodospirillaceae bacterium]|nr:MAG: ABC transporter substrate-binding protein [Rhodospirillaceae bacterium]